MREVEKKGQTNGSYGSGGSQSSSVSNNKEKKSSRSTIRAGDKVVVYLPSGGKAKGTVSAESSRDRYEVTLENGDVEKRVHSRNIELARRRRQEHHHHRNRDDDDRDDDDRRKTLSSSRSQKKKKKKGSPGRRESRHEALDLQHSDHDAPLLLLSGSGSSGGVVGSPSVSSAEAHNVNAERGDRPSSPILREPSVGTSAASEGGGDPAQQPPEVESDSPGTAPAGQAPATIEAPANESEPDTTSNGERGSSSERGLSSPLSSKVRQAQGLLRTVRLEQHKILQALLSRSTHKSSR